MTLVQTAIALFVLGVITSILYGLRLGTNLPVLRRVGRPSALFGLVVSLVLVLGSVVPLVSGPHKAVVTEGMVVLAVAGVVMLIVLGVAPGVAQWVRRRRSHVDS